MIRYSKVIVSSLPVPVLEIAVDPLAPSISSFQNFATGLKTWKYSVLLEYFIDANIPYELVELVLLPSAVVIVIGVPLVHVYVTV